MTPDEAVAVAYRIGLLEKDVERLQAKVDRLTWALVSLSLSIAVSTIVFALTIASSR